MKPNEQLRPDLVGDGYDPEPLMTAAELAEYLRLPTKAVYELNIPRIRLGPRRIRWRPADVQQFLAGRVGGP